MFKLIALRAVCSAFIIFSSVCAFAGAAVGLVTGDNVNVRKSGSTDSEAIAAVSHGDRVEITGRKGEWYSVTVNGKNGWIIDDYLIRLKDAAPEPQSGKTGSSSLKSGSRGSSVKELQNSLIYLGYLKGGADGVFGKNTEKAVELYQKQNRLKVDGIAGRQTVNAVSQESGTIKDVIAEAKKYLGLAYKSGGRTPSGFDCSGLMKYVFTEQTDVKMNSTSRSQAKQGIEVPSSQIRPGDLVFFHSPISHVGMYIGGGKYIHSPQTGDVVKISELNMKKVTAIRRVIGNLVST